MADSGNSAWHHVDLLIVLIPLLPIVTFIVLSPQLSGSSLGTGQASVSHAQSSGPGLQVGAW